MALGADSKCRGIYLNCCKTFTLMSRDWGILNFWDIAGACLYSNSGWVSFKVEWYLIISSMRLFGIVVRI